MLDVGSRPDSVGRSTPQAVSWMVPAAIGVLVLVQFLTRTFERYLEWDEAVYFSQVATDHIPAVLASQRSRLISLVAWPIGIFTDSVVALRIFLVALVSISTLLIGRRLARFGIGAVFGLAIFTISVMPAFYAAELSPNLWVGLLALLIASVVAVPLTIRNGDLAALFVMGGAVVMLRPPDGVIFLTGTGIVMLVRKGLRDFPRTFALAGGGLVGLALWAFDAISRLGSVTAVVDDGSRQVTAGLGFRLALYADRLDGPTRGLNFDGISLPALVPWLVIAALAVGAIVLRRRGDSPVAPQVASFGWLVLVGGLLLAAEYIVGSATQTVRYIFPGWMLVAVGVGLLAGQSIRPAIAQPLAWVVLGVVVVSQVVVLQPFSEEQRIERVPMEVAGEFLGEAFGGDGCAAAAQYGAPQVAFAANCAVSALRGPDRTLAFLDDRAAESGGDAFLLMFGEPADGYETLGTYERLDIGDGRFWSVLRIDAGQ